MMVEASRPVSEYSDEQLISVLGDVLDGPSESHMQQLRLAGTLLEIRHINDPRYQDDLDPQLYELSSVFDELDPLPSAVENAAKAAFDRKFPRDSK